jgi:hypothetical protein
LECVITAVDSAISTGMGSPNSISLSISILQWRSWECNWCRWWVWSQSLVFWIVIVVLIASIFMCENHCYIVNLVLIIVKLSKVRGVFPLLWIWL